MRPLATRCPPNHSTAMLEKLSTSMTAGNISASSLPVPSETLNNAVLATADLSRGEILNLPEDSEPHVTADGHRGVRAEVHGANRANDLHERHREHERARPQYVMHVAGDHALVDDVGVQRRQKQRRQGRRELEYHDKRQLPAVRTEILAEQSDQHGYSLWLGGLRGRRCGRVPLTGPRPPPGRLVAGARIGLLGCRWQANSLSAMPAANGYLSSPSAWRISGRSATGGSERSHRACATWIAAATAPAMTAGNMSVSRSVPIRSAMAWARVCCAAYCARRYSPCRAGDLITRRTPSSHSRSGTSAALA